MTVSTLDATYQPRHSLTLDAIDEPYEPLTVVRAKVNCAVSLNRRYAVGVGRHRSDEA